MKTMKLFYACAFCLLWVACAKDELILTENDETIEWRTHPQNKVTGEIEVFWQGNAGNNPDDSGSMESEKRGFVSFVAFAPEGNKVAKGNFTLEIMEGSDEHRQIIANVFDAVVNPDLDMAWFLAEVTDDSKACGEHGGSGDHDGGSGDHEDDGGDGEDHDEGGDEHDGGCSGEDSDHGNGNVSGRQCRVGQIVAVKAHDYGTPAIEGDMIAWKWFKADSPHLPDITMVNTWPHLCTKDILGGNLVVH